ncbi:agmatinase [Pseudomonadales bacterium]|jgi:guanidinobutyrase|nr:agmatinase [Pseudomonadales bacterium]MDC0994284.1 agmatinase [Pseudomonadales bacterium]MDC3358063.1 agmatinase [Pseudomonadales bacterium]MDG1002644.1 agmatinase [Pseudomonadales bacterium]MDG1302949.1 agmatinase [Pseudomonadales bacterium]|tara:strand:+ start:1168 stop:2127 length:960 start_codon:yes stop_codon:yes gene_type:complete
MSDLKFNQPLSGNDMPRFAGNASMFRLPVSETADGVDVGIIGVPLDIGTSNRNGTRYGPRQVRAESVLVRPYNMATRAAPFDSFQVADLGDVALNPYNLSACIEIIEQHYSAVLENAVTPVSIGGDHTITLPILRAIARKHGPVALIHVDAHADVNDTMFGEPVAHGTIFRRAIEEKLVDPRSMFQIGLRATGYAAEDFDWARDQGVTVVQAEACWYKSLAPLMEEVRRLVGPDQPAYLSFDIDGLDPSVAPGTGTPEPGGLTGSQGLEIIRGCYGLNLIGCDLVEVSPPYDTTGNTALLAANLLFEMLCALPACKRRI